jgi:hypothetical protein
MEDDAEFLDMALEADQTEKDRIQAIEQSMTNISDIRVADHHGQAGNRAKKLLACDVLINGFLSVEISNSRNQRSICSIIVFFLKKQ